MPPSRRRIEVIFSVRNELDGVDYHNVIFKVPRHSMDKPPERINWKCALYLLSHNDDLIVQQFKKSFTSTLKRHPKENDEPPQ